MIGKVFHCLTVTGREILGDGYAAWRCMCSCGKETYAKTYDLTHGTKKSCGHLRTEHNRKYAQMRFKMGSSPPGHQSMFSLGVGMDEALDELDKI